MEGIINEWVPKVSMPEHSTGESRISRRKILKTGSVAAIAGIAGCSGSDPSGDGSESESSGDGSESESSGDGSESEPSSEESESNGTEEMELSVTYEAGFGTEEANAYYARDVAAEEHNLDATITVTDGSDISLQSQVAGQSELSRAGLLNAAPIVEQGKPFKSLFGINSGTDYCLVVNSEEVQSWDDLLSEDGNGPPIGMNNPRNTDVLQIVGSMLERGTLSSDDASSYQDLMNLVQIGYSSARTAAIQTGDIAAGALHHGQWLRIREENPQLENLGYFIDELPYWGSINFMATPDNIEANQELYTRWAKSHIQASRELREGSADQYVEVVRKYAPGGGPDEEELRQTYSFIEEVGLYPNNGGLSEDAMDFMLDLADLTGVTESRVPTDEMFDSTVLDAALDDLGRM
jgi:hypothetical protein